MSESMLLNIASMGGRLKLPSPTPPTVEVAYQLFIQQQVPLETKLHTNQ